MNSLIGFVGFKGSGKDTAANHLIRRHCFQPMAFADSIKDCLASIFCWDRDLLEGRTKQGRIWRETIDPWWSDKLGIRDFTPRLAMTSFGTDVMRDHFNPDLWLLNVERRFSTLSDHDVVIKDVRFPNELQLIRRLGGRVYRIRRGPEPVWYADAHTAVSSIAMPLFDFRMLEERLAHIHISEYACLAENFDGVIDNDGSVADLHAKIEALRRDAGA